MPSAESFVTEMLSRNQDSTRNLLNNFLAMIQAEALSGADLLRLDIKNIIEMVEAAALWLTDCDTLEMKLALATQCGDGAHDFQLAADRLEALGIPLASLDPRYGGYTKLFAFFRSLQTQEERAAAGFVTLRAITLARHEAVANLCAERGDAPTAQLYREGLAAGARKHFAVGQQLLLAAATTEESQARARRAAFRTIELVGELQDPLLIKKYLSRSQRK